MIEQIKNNARAPRRGVPFRQARKRQILKRNQTLKIIAPIAFGAATRTHERLPRATSPCGAALPLGARHPVTQSHCRRQHCRQDAIRHKGEARARTTGLRNLASSPQIQVSNAGAKTPPASIARQHDATRIIDLFTRPRSEFTQP
jgi:hypothetical protein